MSHESKSPESTGILMSPVLGRWETPTKAVLIARTRRDDRYRRPFCTNLISITYLPTNWLTYSKIVQATLSEKRPSAGTICWPHAVDWDSTTTQYSVFFRHGLIFVKIPKIDWWRAITAPRMMIWTTLFHPINRIWFQVSAEHKVERSLMAFDFSW